MLNKLHFDNLSDYTPMIEIRNWLYSILFLLSPLVVDGDKIITIEIIVLLYHIISFLPIVTIPKH